MYTCGLATFYNFNDDYSIKLMLLKHLNLLQDNLDGLLNIDSAYFEQIVVQIT